MSDGDVSDGDVSDGQETPGGAGGSGGGDSRGPYGSGGEGARGAYEDVGSVAEEAAKLFGVFAGWTHEVGDHVATGAPECTYCPVCRTIHVVRECSPEVRDHLATAAASLMQAAAGVLAAVSQQPGGEAGGTEGRDAEGRGVPVEHIDLDPDDD